MQAEAGRNAGLMGGSPEGTISELVEYVRNFVNSLFCLHSQYENRDFRLLL